MTYGDGYLSALIDADVIAAMDRRVIPGDTLRKSAPQRFELGGFTISIDRNTRDADDVRRITIRRDDGTSLDLLPSKGLSVGRWTHAAGDVFWRIPVRGLISPDLFDPLGAMLVNGERVESLRWIENFAGAVELLGLSNWGMPTPDKNGVVLPLHGEASQIPVDECTILADSRCFAAVGSYDVPDGWWRAEDSAVDDPSLPWYRRGRPGWRVTRSLVLDPFAATLRIVDAIGNVGHTAARPDWGYHVQLKPEPGARFIVPSADVTSRFGGEVATDHATWHAADDPTIRTERGYIHTGVETSRDPLGGQVVETRAEYPDGRRVAVTMPAAPYMLSWFSCGGTGGREFDRPERPDGSYMEIGWDGFGPEFGASALDHDGAGDPSIVEPKIDPGDTRTLYLAIDAS